MDAPAPAVERPGRMDSLQVLRAVAALAVVLFHCNWTGIASFGVELFFVLSGFIICHAAAVDPEWFLLKRAFRVIPLYWTATLGIFAVALAVPALVPSTVPSLDNLLRSLLFVPYLRADGESFPLLFLGWTLNYEAFFYAVFALALALGGRRAPLLALAMLGGAILARPWLAGLGFAFEFWTSPILLNFICGIFAWYVWRLAGHGLRSAPAVLAGPVAIACLAAFVFGLGPRLGGAFPWNGALGVVLLLALLRLDGAVRWPAWLLLIGDASYSLYLLHPYVLELFNRLIHPFGPDPLGIAVTSVAVLLAIGVAIASFRLLERPSNHALRRLLK